jgi:hypothetical protein
MGFLDAYKKRSGGTDVDANDGYWSSGFSTPSVTGIQVNQLSALNSSPVIAATTMLAEDVAKLPWSPFRYAEDGSRREAQDHYLYDLLQEPNEWMNGLEYREMKQIGLVLRGNTYSLIKRNGRGRPIALIPWNPDHVNEWIGGDGSIFYRFNPSNLHEIAILKGFPFLVPAEDVLHIRGFSLNGLLGMSRIALAREAIGLSLAQEQQAARWMGNGAKPSGMLTTDQKLTDTAAKRLAADFKSQSSGLQNSGKVIVGEQGLKFQPFSMTVGGSRVHRLAQIPDRGDRAHLPDSAAHAGRAVALDQQQHRPAGAGIYQLHADRLHQPLARQAVIAFRLRRDRISRSSSITRDLTTADMTSRINNWRIAIMSMMAQARTRPASISAGSRRTRAPTSCTSRRTWPRRQPVDRHRRRRLGSTRRFLKETGHHVQANDRRYCGIPRSRWSRPQAWRCRATARPGPADRGRERGPRRQLHLLRR